MEEYNLYKNAGLQEIPFNDTHILSQAVDWDFVDSDGFTNYQRVFKLKKSPVDSTNTAFELHHIGQSNNSPLAVLTASQHRFGNSNKILHTVLHSGVEHGPAWEKLVNSVWRFLYEASLAA